MWSYAGTMWSCAFVLVESTILFKGEKYIMKICLKCKQLCNNDTLTKCPKCKGELIQYSEEKYKYYLNNQKQENNKYTSKEDRMYKDIHTIKNTLVLFAVLAIITFVVNFFIMMG